MTSRSELKRNEAKWRSDGEGRVDANGVRWWACDPYPTWYRRVDGVLHTAGGTVYSGVDERPTWDDDDD